MGYIIEQSRFEDAKKLSLLLLEKKNIEKYTPEQLADEYIKYTRIILSKIDDVDFTSN